MTENSLRRTNWTERSDVTQKPRSAARPLELAPRALPSDPLRDLELALSAGEGERRPVQQSPSVRASDDFFSGIDPRAFEAALNREPVAAAPARQAAATKVQEWDEREFLNELEEKLFEIAPASPVVKAAGREQEAMPSRAAAPLHVQSAGDQGAPSFDEEADLPPSVDEAAPSSPRKKTRGLATVIAALGLVVVGLGGAGWTYFFSGRGYGGGGEPVVVKADPRPNRVEAPTAPEPASANNKVIFDRLGSNQTPPQAERIVPREEQPAANLPAANPQNPNPPSSSAQLSEPRRVATTTIRVKPDGSLESEPTRAPSSQIPAQAPAPARSETSSAPPLSGSPTALGGGQPSPLSTTSGPRSAPVSVPTIAAVPPPAAALPAARPPIASQQPVPPVSSAPASRGEAQIPEQAAAAGGFMVQISSQRSREAAEHSFADLQRRFPALFAGRSADIREVDLGSKGIYYRVRLGPLPTRGEANEFCGRLKSSGASCVVTAG